MIKNFFLYVNTIKYLKIVQIVNRIKRKIFKPKPRFMIGKLRNIGAGIWDSHFHEKQSLFEDNQCEFLNLSHQINCISDWTSPSKSDLWIYNLHYFNDLNSYGANMRRDLQQSWMKKWRVENQIGFGKGWDPYPVSIRIVNWIKAFKTGLNTSPDLLNSLATQAEWLSHCIEWHLLGNHLFSNAKALVFAGDFLDGPDADRWKAMGLEIISTEIDEQILEDGGNFELSPMYHALMLIDLLDLLNLSNAIKLSLPAKLVKKIEAKAIKMLSFMDGVCHLDGNISFFNDATFGIAPDRASIFQYAQKLGLFTLERNKKEANGLIISDFKESGYISARTKDFSLIADLGQIGASYIPGHAHADTLSFELCFGSERIFVNSGVSEYGFSKNRLTQRKTKSHNTVSINQMDSSEVWHGFRVGRRAKIIDRYVDHANQEFSASHDGFWVQGCKCIHKRKWKVSEHEVVFEDELDGDFESAEGYLHPNVQIQSQVDDKVILTNNGTLIEVHFEGCQVSVAPTTWNPQFGTTLPTKLLIFKFYGSRVSTKISWDEVSHETSSKIYPVQW